MREYIKRNQHASVMLFKRGSAEDYARAEAIDAHNTDVAQRLLKGLLSGSIDYAYMREGTRLIVYTRSLYGPHVQASYFTEAYGEPIANMHQDILNAQHLEHSFIHGRYLNIAPSSYTYDHFVSDERGSAITDIQKGA